MPKANHFPLPSIGQFKDGEILDNMNFPFVIAAIPCVTMCYIYTEEWATV